MTSLPPVLADSATAALSATLGWAFLIAAFIWLIIWKLLQFRPEKPSQFKEATTFGPDRISSPVTVPEATAKSAPTTGKAINISRAPKAEPAATSPTESPSEPAPSEPAPSEPAPSEPAPSEPTPSEPTPSEPAPSEPAPSEPAPSEPAPSEPAPSEPAPSEPASSEPASSEPTSSEPAPSEPADTSEEPAKIASETSHPESAKDQFPAPAPSAKATQPDLPLDEIALTIQTATVEEAAARFRSELDAGIVRQDDSYGIVFVDPADAPDDLKKIKGVAKVLEGKLNQIGVYQFRQIAVWTAPAVREFSKLLPNFKDRIYRDDWIAQAKRLHEEKHGEKL